MFLKRNFRFIAVFLILFIFISISIILLTKKPEKNEGVKYLIGVSQPNLSEPWRVELVREIRAQADNYPDVKVIYYDAVNDDIKQKRNIMDMLEQKIDLLIVTPKNPGFLSEIINTVYNSGIPVILLENKAEGIKYSMFIYSDNYKIGSELGMGNEALLHALKILKGENVSKELDLRSESNQRDGSKDYSK